MSRRTVGALFILISCLLLCSWFIAAATFGSNMQSWTAVSFKILLTSVGSLLPNLAISSLVIGTIYLIWAEWSKKEGD